MKILHTTLQPWPAPSIVNQLLWEQTAARQQGIPWDVKMFCPKESTEAEDIIQFSSHARPNDCKSFLPRMKFRHTFLKEYYEWLSHISEQYDVILLRYNTCDSIQSKFVSNSTKKIYLVHHTLRFEELNLEQNPCLRFARYWVEKKFGQRTLQHATGIVGVTDEILQYEKRHSSQSDKLGFIYPNGVQVTDEIPQDKRTQEIELIFVASDFHSWHGLDLLLDATEKTKESFVLHLVGNISSFDRERALADSRIRMHGTLTQKEIADLSARCTVGLSSFAIHRKKMKEACTRKVREYLMLGLPVYAAHKDVFDEQFPFYRNDTCDMDSILKYAKEMQPISRAEVFEAATPYISKEVLVQRLYSQLVESSKK
ncbi:MAG: glycosyltransferase family 1 protein [Gammaproteobacteria bacterium]|nr:glycosyltransferase family 1 protein [Gammaproteobacteria bacterium]